MPNEVLTTDLVSHTPGPWEGDPQGDGLGVRVWDKAGHNMIAALDEDAAAGACFVPEVRTREANARLIAAAPDLLAALKAVVAISDRKHDAWDTAHLAIAKANGTDPCEDCNKRPITGDDALCDGCRDNRAEVAYERSLSECHRGGEYASALAEEQARIQRELK